MSRREVFRLRVPDAGAALEVLLAPVYLAFFRFQGIAAGLGLKFRRQLVVALDEDLGGGTGCLPAALEAIALAFLDGEEFTVASAVVPATSSFMLNRST